MRLILFVSLVAESRSGRVESHTKVSRLLPFENISQCIDKTKDSRGVHSLGVDTGIFDEGIIGAVDKRIGIEKEEFFHVVSF